MVTLRAWWHLLRGGNAILAGVAGAIGAWLIEPSGGWQLYSLAAAAPLLITGAGNIQNDLCDVAIDRMNRPDRPIPSGRIGSTAARAMHWVLTIAGLGSAFWLGWSPLAIAGGVVLGLAVYNHRLSGTPLWGNLLIALLGALPVVYGASAVGLTFDRRLFVVLTFAAIAFWLHLARELLKDILDREGDIVAQRETIPILYSERIAMRLASASMIFAAMTTVWPWVNGWLGPLYLIGVLLTVVPALLLGAAQCWWRIERTVASMWSVGLKLTMLAGLVWIILGAARI